MLGEGGRECSPAGCRVESGSPKSKFSLPSSISPPSFPSPPSLLFSFLHFLHLLSLLPSLSFSSLDSIATLTNQMIGHKLKTKQTTGDGVLVKKVKTITSLRFKDPPLPYFCIFHSTSPLSAFSSLFSLSFHMCIHTHTCTYTLHPFPPPLHTHTHTHR